MNRYEAVDLISESKNFELNDGVFMMFSELFPEDCYHIIKKRSWIETLIGNELFLLLFTFFLRN